MEWRTPRGSCDNNKRVPETAFEKVLIKEEQTRPFLNHASPFLSERPLFGRGQKHGSPKTRFVPPRSKKGY